MDFFVNQVPGTKKGMITNHMVNGRIAAGLAPHGGIAYVNYVGKQHCGQQHIFRADYHAAFSKLLRMQVIIDDQPYYFEPNNTLYYPFGFSTECTLNGVSLRYDTVLDQDALIQRMTVVSNPEGRKVRARILQHGHLSVTNANEKITWEVKENGVLAGTRPDGTVNCDIISAQPAKAWGCYGQFKFYAEITEASDAPIFALVFDKKPEELADVAANLNARMDALFAAYRDHQENGIRVTTGHEVLDSSINNIIPTLECLAIKDVPGAVRASHHYWVWGWDTMVHADAYLWAGKTEIVRDMLDFYRIHSHPERGIGHAFSTEFDIDIVMRAASQGLYVTLLHNYYAVTGDLETVQRNLPFAYKILDISSAKMHDQLTLGCGKGWIPDEPALLKQAKDNSDISLVNNSLFLQALRSIAALERALNLPGDQEHDKLADAMQKDMETYLWDEEKHYWVENMDGKTLEKRTIYPLWAQMHVTPFALLPHGKDCKEIAEFMKKRFIFEAGLYTISPEDEAWMADGNQIGAYYPNNDRYFWNIMNAAEETGTFEDYRRIVEHYWQEHSYPEGVTHETVNADPTSDEPGCKQAFSMKAWFCDAIQLNLGLQVYLDGFTCHPLKTGTPFKVENLNLRGHKLTLERTVAGDVLLNGKPMSSKVTWAELVNY